MDRLMDIKFPKWNPQYYTKQRFGSSDFNIRYKALRNSSSGFIKRKDVRKIIYNKYNGKCYLCGNNENLQIDHIVSVYKCALNEFPVELLNSEDNLALICRRCNSAKLP